MQTQLSGNQDDVTAFLSDPASFPDSVDKVDRIETHGATVFLAGDFAYKIKKAVSFDYMDFSSLEKRRVICERELEINQPHAPEIYVDLVAINRSPDGQHSLDGPGETVEWAIRMNRFDQAMLLDRVASDGRLADETVIQLAKIAVDYHASAPPVTIRDGAAKMASLITQLDTAFGACPDVFSPEDKARFKSLARAQLERAKYSLRLRGRRGCVRRCHGDLHLKNIVMIDGRPTLFDAIEFNEELATIDIFYDLAFLIMDLDQRGMRRHANMLLNRYLHYSSAPSDVYGLAAMPLFLGCRAGVRAMVAMDRVNQSTAVDAEELLDRARQYSTASLAYLDPPQARAVAVGGLSGSGKSTLAAALAPLIGSAPGALHLRTDLERKAMFNVAETERLTHEAYTQEASDRVYDMIMQKARVALKAGHSVIVDAVFLRADERAAIEAAASRHGVPFTGLWLNAPRESLIARVDSRTGDASDATASVVEQQLAAGTGPVAWQPLDAGGGASETLARAKTVLGLA